MKLSILCVIISTIFATGHGITCYQCVDGDQSNVKSPYKTCNKYLDNYTCNTANGVNRCVTYVSNYLNKRTVVHDCYSGTDLQPFRFDDQNSRRDICGSDLCNRDENWGRYNTAASVTLKTPLVLFLISSLFFL